MSQRSRIYWIIRGLISLLVALVFLGFVFLVLISLGLVQGEEFSPDDFSSRRFSYIRLPIFNWVARGIEYENSTTDFESSLTKDGWISSQPASVWHLCNENQTRQPAECDARFLVDMLRIESDSEHEYYWQEWNELHPKLGKVFWPLIAMMARDEMYLAIPEIMELAMNVQHRPSLPSAAEFEGELKKKIASAYQKLADLDSEKGRTERSQARRQRAAELLNE